MRKNKECVIAIPTVEMLDKVVGIGTCSEQDTDKFAKFNLTPLPGKVVRAPLVVGDGTFIVGARKLDRKKLMASKLPKGV